ncbi:MAG: dihydrodipicolinate synthase family protein, partial [Nitrospinaceae bacterium]|nr:dihydrodipicolinate synthase family protein [Nitrospinaceae bacterium]
HYEMREVNDVLFIDTNPVPVKAALHLMGKIENEVRTPLVTLSSSHLESVKEVLNKHGLY